MTCNTNRERGKQQDLLIPISTTSKVQGLYNVGICFHCQMSNELSDGPLHVKVKVWTQVGEIQRLPHSPQHPEMVATGLLAD